MGPTSHQRGWRLVVAAIAVGGWTFLHIKFYTPNICIHCRHKSWPSKPTVAKGWPPKSRMTRIYFCNKFETWYFYFCQKNRITLKFLHKEKAKMCKLMIIENPVHPPQNFSLVVVTKKYCIQNKVEHVLFYIKICSNKLNLWHQFCSLKDINLVVGARALKYGGQQDHPCGIHGGMLSLFHWWNLDDSA
jgi:hypothetical protein